MSHIVPADHDRTARRHSAVGRPPTVSTYEELHGCIQSMNIPEMTATEDGERVLSFLLPGDSLLVTTQRQLELLRSATMLQADATYKVAPKNFGKQLFTVHGLWHNSSSGGTYVSFPEPC